MTITYHDLMHAARAALRAAGVDDEANKLEAQDLICAAAGKTPEQLYRDFSAYVFHLHCVRSPFFFLHTTYPKT